MQQSSRAVGQRHAAVDPQALREELSLGERADVAAPEFRRFVIRLSEALDFDIPTEDLEQLATVSGCTAYLSALPHARS